MSKRKSGTAPPSIPADRVVDPLAVVTRWFRLRVHERINECIGLPLDRSAISILEMLWRHGPVRMSQVADLLGIDRSTLSRQMAAVVAAGYVEKRADNSDARAVLLSLTDEGQAIRQQISEAWDQIAKDLVADWDYADRVDVGRLLGRLAVRLQDDRQ